MWIDSASIWTKQSTYLNDLKISSERTEKNSLNAMVVRMIESLRKIIFGQSFQRIKYWYSLRSEE
jgi:hypothetical protein